MHDARELASLGGPTERGGAVRWCGLLSTVWFACTASPAVFLVSNTNHAGPGSLRQAILDANASPGADRIEFGIPGSPPFAIAPSNALPQVTDPVTIDATGQPGYAGSPCVLLSGTRAGSGAHGLLLLAGQSTVKGLVISRFAGDGIRIEGAGSNVVAGNFVGTDVTGRLPQGNIAAGISLLQSADNRIGGPGTGEGNLISGANDTGIYVTGSRATNNWIAGNRIGVDITGLNRLSNVKNGILIYEAGGNRVGGATRAEGNVLSGNGACGVYLSGSAAADNRIEGNFIGTTATGTGRLGNGAEGILLSGAPRNWIGGALPGSGNLISGNLDAGVFLTGTGARSNHLEGNAIGTDLTGSLSLGNGNAGVIILAGADNWVGSSDPAGGNLISGNTGSGVLITNAAAQRNVIEGNVIGTDRTTTNALPNGIRGVALYAPSNRVGVVAGNVISGNRENGVFIYGTAAQGNRISGNHLGTDLAGRVGRGNGLCGVFIDGAPANMIGGTEAGAGNLISAHPVAGVYLSGNAASNNCVQGNWIGTDHTGARALGNSDGLGITDGAYNLIGGTLRAARNVISGNTNRGLFILGAQAQGNRFEGNFIGTDATGLAALPNLKQGILVSAPSNTFGGLAPGAGNLVSANGNVGVSIGDPVSQGNTVLGNWIGLAADGLGRLGNQFHNVEILNQAGATQIGGDQPGAGNRIAYTVTAGHDGVRIRDGCTGNTVRGNSIFGNAGLGIDLSTDGVSLNDLQDPDGGANFLQNFPELTAAAGRYQTAVSGTFNSSPSRGFLLDFYFSFERDPSEYGEGQFWLGSHPVTTDAAGNASFELQFRSPFPLAGFITATATDAAGNTSEFSRALANSAPASPDRDADGLPDDYEIAWGFNPLNPLDALLDADGDGSSNLDEYRALTRPDDPTDCLRFIRFQRVSAGTFELEFPSKFNRRYSVQRSDTLSGPWLDVATNLPGNQANLRVLDTNALQSAQRFYRLLCIP